MPSDKALIFTMNSVVLLNFTKENPYMIQIYTGDYMAGSCWSNEVSLALYQMEKYQD